MASLFDMLRPPFPQLVVVTYLKMVTAKGTSCPVHSAKRQMAIGSSRMV